MIKIPKDETAPSDSVMVINDDDFKYCYFANDIEVVDSSIESKKNLKLQEMLSAYNKEKHDTGVNKKTFLGMQASVIAGVGRGGDDANKTKQKFKAIVLARQELQDKRGAKILEIESATTIEELEAISWT